MEDINIIEIPQNENPKKVANIYENILLFNEKQNGRGLKKVTPKQMVQILSIALTQVKAGNTWKKSTKYNLTNQIVYSLYWEKWITKKQYNNIINLIKS